MGSWGCNESFFRKKFFYSAQLDMKIQLAAKFQKKTDGRLSRISPDTRTDARTHARTDATENNGPSPINRGTKNILVGCHYRHHTDLANYNTSYLQNLTKKLNEQNNKPCVLMGDFNVNLLAYGEHTDTGNFMIFSLLSHSNH